MSDYCDWCDEPAVHREEITEARKVLGKQRQFGTGRYLRACEAHKGLAVTQALSFVSSTKGNLAQEFEAEARG